MFKKVFKKLGQILILILTELAKDTPERQLQRWYQANHGPHRDREERHGPPNLL